MSKSNNIAKNIKLHPIDSLFYTEQSENTIAELPLNELYPFQNHPYRVLEDESMQELVESICQYGVLQPIIVRSRCESGYEIIAGHRRKRACELAGKDTIPAMITNLDNEEAIIQMVDSNLYREKLLFSEKAFAYKMRLDAMKRKAGRPTKNYSQLGNNLAGTTSISVLEEETGESKSQIYRLIRLTCLIDKLLDMVDNEKLALNAAEKISYLSTEFQNKLFDFIDLEQVIPTVSQATKLKQFYDEGKLTEETLLEILDNKKTGTFKVTLKGKSLNKFFSPREYTPKQIEEIIIGLLEKWQEKK